MWRGGSIGLARPEECGVDFWRFLGSWLCKVFVVDPGSCGGSGAKVRVGSGRWLCGEFAGEVWEVSDGRGAGEAREKVAEEELGVEVRV